MKLLYTDRWQFGHFLIALLVLSIPLEMQATVRTWTGNASNNDTRWSLFQNWNNGAPATNDDLVFPTGASHPNNQNDLVDGMPFNSLSIGGNNYSLSGNSITLTAGILVTNSGNVVNINNGFILNANQSVTVGGGTPGLNLKGAINNNGYVLTFSNTSPAVVQVSSIVSGAGGLSKIGTGTLIVSNGTYTGATIVSNGTLRVDGSQASSAVALYGGTLTGFGSVGAISALGTDPKIIDPGTGIGILNSSNVVLDGNTTFLAQLSGGAPGTGYDQLNVTGTVNLGGAALSVALGFTPTGANSFVIVNNDGNDPVIGTFNGLPEGTVFTNSGAVLRITYAGGDGNDVVLKAFGSTRTWSGGGTNGYWTTPLNWAGGVAPNPFDDLVFPSESARLTSTNDFPANTTFNSIAFVGTNYTLFGSNILLNAGITATNTTGENFILLPIKLLADQSIVTGNSGVNLSLVGDVDLGANNLTFAGNGVAQVQSYISGAGGIIKKGSGSLSLYTSNSFSGPAQILQGSVTLYQGDVLGSTNSVATVSNALFNLVNGITVPKPLNLWTGVNALNGTNFLSGPITLSTSNVFMQANGGASLVIRSTVSGTGSISKIGLGSLIMNGTNTYTGGTYLTSGRLGGFGTIGTVTASGIGTQMLAPGAGPGLLTCSNVALSVYSTYQAEIMGIFAGIGYDQLKVNGTVALSNATLAVSLGYTPTNGTSFMIIDNDGTDPVIGTFSGLPSGALITNGATIFRIAYNGGDGNDVTLTTGLATPPATISTFSNLPNAYKQITGQGISNLTYTIQAATNLNAPITWSNVGSALANATGVFQFTDTNAPLFPMRFYRVLSP